MAMTRDQIMAVREVARAILDTVKEAGPCGAPGGVMYAALMGAGCSLSQFESIMGTLVRAGKLRKDGDCYHFLASL